MILKELQIKNIRSYEELLIRFPRGAVLLAGDIGAGKTSILLAVQFALFGLQPGQKGASLMRYGSEQAYVRLELEIDGRDVVLERTLKRGKNGSISQDSNVLTIDGERQEYSTSEMKEKVISLLNYPREYIKKSNLLYRFTVYTPQESMKEIVQEKPEVRLDSLRHVFGIDKYKRIKENAQIFAQKIREQVRIKEVLVSELNLLREKLGMENEKKIQLARAVGNLRVEIQKLEQAKKEAEDGIKVFEEKMELKRKLDSELLKLNALVQGKRDLSERLKKDIFLAQKQLSQRVEFSEERFRELEELLSRHKDVLDEKNRMLVEVSSRISVLISKKEDAENLKKGVMSLENCPTCFQEVGQAHKEKIAKKSAYEIQEIELELEKKRAERESLVKEIEREKELISGYEKDLNKLKEDKIKYEHQKELETKMKSDGFVLDRTMNEIRDLEKQIGDLKERVSGFGAVEEEYNSKQKELKEIVDVYREKEVEFAAKNKELDILKMRIEELEGDIAEKEKVKRDLERLKGLHAWLQGDFLKMVNVIEKNVLVKLRKEFSRIFNEWFSLLVSDKLSVRIDEDFSPLISNQGCDIDYDFLSGGERTAVALAYRLALNQVLNSMLSSIKTKGIIILDEPTDGFSSEQIDKMRDIFEQLNTEQIILVSHEQKIEGFVDHIIRVRKDRTSWVEQS